MHGMIGIVLVFVGMAILLYWIYRTVRTSRYAKDLSLRHAKDELGLTSAQEQFDRLLDLKEIQENTAALHWLRTKHHVLVLWLVLLMGGLVLLVVSLMQEEIIDENAVHKALRQPPAANRARS